MKSNFKAQLIIMIIIFTICLSFNAYFSIPYYKMNVVKFQNLDNIHLSARYLPSQNGKGVIIATDLAHDKSELTSMIYELSNLGYGIYVFDFPSQGNSEGNIPFHYNEKTYLAEQFYCALVSYAQLANMNEKDIHIIGYGTGARAILQTASMGFIQPASMTLIGTDINLTNKIQFNILNFTVDPEIDWIKNLSKYTGGCPINIIAAKADNLSTLKDNEALADLLRRDPVNGTVGAKTNTVTYTGNAFSIHYLLMNNVKITQQTVSEIAKTDNLTYLPEDLLKLRILSLLTMFFLLPAFIYIVNIYLKYTFPDIETNNANPPENFIKSKLILWIPTIIVLVALPVLLYLIPINYPYNDIFRLSLFCSYGVLMFIIYKFTNFGNNIGRNFFSNDGLKNVKGGVITGLIMIFLLVLISLSGMFHLFSLYSKWLWIAIFTALCMLTFFIDEKERKVLSHSFRDKVFLILINYLGIFIAPFILLAFGMFHTAFMILLMIGVLILVLSLELIFIRINSPIKINAFIKAFIFQLLVFAQSTMFFH